MHRKFGNCWVEYRDPIDLMDHPSNMRIGLCWYKKGTTNKWTYDLTNFLIINLETITTLASMTYIVHFDAYELHLGDEKPSTALLMNARVFIILMIGVHYYSKTYLYTFVNDHI